MGTSILLDVVMRVHGLKREQVEAATEALYAALDKPLRVGTRSGLKGEMKRVRFGLDRLDEAVALVYVNILPSFPENFSKFAVAELHKLFALYVDVPLMDTVTYTVMSIRLNPDKWGELMEE
jgi:hypothetical protein